MIMRERNTLNVKELLNELKDVVFFPMLFFYPSKETQESARPSDFKVLKEADVLDHAIFNNNRI